MKQGSKKLLAKITEYETIQNIVENNAARTIGIFVNCP